MRKRGAKHQHPPCWLCGRPAEEVVGRFIGEQGSTGQYAEPATDHKVGTRPLCHECALSAWEQLGLDWHCDGYRITGWPVGFHAAVVR